MNPIPRTHRGAAGRVQLIDREPTSTDPEPAVIMRRIVAEALILQDQAEAVLAAIAHGEQLGSAAPRGGPLVRRFFALADELPAGGNDPGQRHLIDSIHTILIHHATQVSTAIDFLAVAWRSEKMARCARSTSDLGNPAKLLEQIYREL